jgi:hypothetical protein
MLNKMEDYYNDMKFLGKLKKYKEKDTFFQDNIVVRCKGNIILVINSIKIN